MWIQVVYFLHNCCELLVRLFSLHRKIIDFMKTQGLGDQTNVNVGEFYFPLFICMSLCCCFFVCLFRFAIQHTSDICVTVLAHFFVVVELKTNSFNLIPGTWSNTYCCSFFP